MVRVSRLPRNVNQSGRGNVQTMRTNVFRLDGTKNAQYWRIVKLFILRRHEVFGEQVEVLIVRG